MPVADSDGCSRRRVRIAILAFLLGGGCFLAGYIFRGVVGDVDAIVAVVKGNLITPQFSDRVVGHFKDKDEFFRFLRETFPDCKPSVSVVDKKDFLCKLQMTAIVSDRFYVSCHKHFYVDELESGVFRHPTHCRLQKIVAAGARGISFDEGIDLSLQHMRELRSHAGDLEAILLYLEKILPESSATMAPELKPRATGPSSADAEDAAR